MLSFRVSRIIATLFHRAIFLLIADVLAGQQWFLINNFTALIDFIFGADYEYLSSYQDVSSTLTGIGFLIMWWMVHFLATRQLWFNGVLVELFILVQVLGYLSNLAYTTTNPYHPLLIVIALHFLLIIYRSYLAQLRFLDPEQTFYRFSQLRKPFVPNRALQLIQLTPIMYTVLHKVKGVIDEGTHARLRYSLGMADAIVYVGINMDLLLITLSRIVGTLRTAYRDFAFSHLAWMFRVNITGSYMVLIRDIGWRSIPADQLHMSWFIYWIMKIVMIVILWTQLSPGNQPLFLPYLCQELSGSFVAATATVYFSCLIIGTLLTFLATLFTYTADVIPKTNVIQNCFDTVQHIRWNSFPWKTNPVNRVYIIVYAVMFGQIPLCGKMIQHISQVTRKACFCRGHKWALTLGGIIMIILYFMYSLFVFQVMNIAVPNVSKCFAKQVSLQALIWIAYNGAITVVELITLCVHQGLPDIESRKNLQEGAGVMRTFLTAVLAIFLTGVNIMGLSESVTSQVGACGYRDITHNLIQIIARATFLYIALQSRTTSQTLKQIRNVESLAYRKRSQLELPDREDQSPCGLCYDKDIKDLLTKLDNCGHTFHDRCFASWKNFGHRCPICRTVFRKPLNDTNDSSEEEEEEDSQEEDSELTSNR